METRCRITSGGSSPDPGTVPQRGDRPARLMAGGVRVKGCGKSAPRRRQRAPAWQTPPGARPNRNDRAPARAPGLVSRLRRSGWLLEAVGNVRPRGMAATLGGNPEPYRTRLTGRLTASLRRCPRFSDYGAANLTGFGDSINEELVMTDPDFGPRDG